MYQSIIIAAYRRGCRSWSTRGCYGTARGSLLFIRCVCSIYPFGVDVYRFREVLWVQVSAREQCGESEGSLTIDFTLVPLVAHAAHELRNTLFSVEFDCYRVVMVAEETGKGGVCIGAVIR